jgi:hypothetical protein
VQAPTLGGATTLLLAGAVVTLVAVGLRVADRARAVDPSARLASANGTIIAGPGGLDLATPLGPAGAGAQPLVIDSSLGTGVRATDEGASTLLTLAASTLPTSATEPGSIIRVRPPVRAAGVVGPGARVLQNSVAALASSRADRVLLTSGRTVTGRVEVVRPSVIVFRDVESGLRYELPKQEIREIVTEFGTRIRFRGDGSPATERAANARARGFGGSYRMRYALVDVSGTPDCRAVRPPSDAADLVVVAHAPGADTLTLAVQAGPRWNAVVDEEGLFNTVFAIQPDQAYSSSAFTSRMSGRFTASGIEGEITLLSYRRVRVGRDPACQLTLKAKGERVNAPRSPLD